VKSCLTKEPDSLLQRDDWLDGGSCLSYFSKAFYINILIDKLMKYELDKWRVTWPENWLSLKGCDQWQGSQLEASHKSCALFNFVSNEVDDGTEHTLG